MGQEHHQCNGGSAGAILHPCLQRREQRKLHTFYTYTNTNKANVEKTSLNIQDPDPEPRLAVLTAWTGIEPANIRYIRQFAECAESVMFLLRISQRMY